MRNILFIHTGGTVEVFLSLPAVRAVRNRFPEAYLLAIAGGPPGEVFRLGGDLDEVLSLGSGNAFFPTRQYSLFGFAQAANRLRSRTCDVAVEFHAAPEDGVLAFLSGAKMRLGQARDLGRRLAAWLHSDATAASDGRHLSDKYFEIITPLGVEVPDRAFRLQAPAAALATIDKQLLKSGWRTGEPLVIFHQGSDNLPNVWADENFAALGCRLVNEFGARLVVFETVADDRRSRIAALLRAQLKRPPTFLKALTFPEVLALAARSSLIVGHNRAPVHLAAAVGAPVLALMDAGRDSSVASVRGSRHRLAYTSPLRPLSTEQAYGLACEILQGDRLSAIFDA